MTLELLKLEERQVLSALYNPDNGPSPFPDFDGPIYYTYANFSNPTVLDTVYVAGEGGSCRVKIISGGTGQYVLINDPEFGNTFVLEGEGTVLFDGFAFPNSTEERIGIDVAATHDNIYFTWLAGGGPIVSKATLQDNKLVFTEFLAADSNYRGGLQLVAGRVAMMDSEFFNKPENSDLIIIPKAGGGPILRAYDAEGNQIVNLLFGHPDDRRQWNFAPASIGFQIILPYNSFNKETVNTGKYGFAIESPSGGTYVMSWDGSISVGPFE